MNTNGLCFRILRPITAVLVALAVIAGACGDDESDAPDEVSATETTTTESPTSTAAPTPTTEAPTTTETPTTTSEAPSGRCSLLVDSNSVAGLGSSGSDVATAVATISAECGQPDADTGWIYGCLAGVSWPEGPTADELPLREVRWGALTMYFARSYELIDTEEGKVALYTDDGELWMWNYGLHNAADTSVALVNPNGEPIELGTPMSDVVEQAVSQLPQMDEGVAYELSAFGVIRLTGDDGTILIGEVAPSAEPVDSVQEAIEYSTLSNVGGLPVCAG